MRIARITFGVAVAALCTSSPCRGQDSGGAPVSIVALTGQIAPGTGGGHFSSLSRAIINNRGQIAFLAGVTGGNAARGIFEFSSGKLSAVVLQGQPASDLPGFFFSDFGDPDINDSGDMIFDARLGGAAYSGVFHLSGQTLHKVVVTGTDVPGAPGQKFSLFRNPRLNNRGDIAFESDLEGNFLVPSGIFMMSGGALKPIVLGNQMLAGTNQVYGGSDFSLNNLGDVVFASQSLSLGGPNGVFLYSEGTIARIALGEVLDSALRLQSLSQPWINDRREIVFRDQIEPNHSALVLWRSGSFEKIAMSGDPAAQFEDAHIGNDLGDVQINNNGMISLRIRIVFGGSNIHDAVFTKQDGKFAYYVKEGDSLYDVGRFDFLGAIQTSDQGTLTFVSNMTSGDAGIFTTSLGRYTLAFPQIADGGNGASWRTTFNLANRSTVPSSATISFWNDDGSPLALSIQGQASSQLTVSLPALGTLKIQTEGGGALKTGWALVQSDQSLSGVAIFSYFDGAGHFVDEVGAPSSLDFGSMSLFAESSGSVNTGIALANPNSEPADVTLTLRDSQAMTLAVQQLKIPANGHIAKYLTELFSPGVIPLDFQGRIEVVSTESLVGLTLRQRDQIFTSLPVVP